MTRVVFLLMGVVLLVLAPASAQEIVFDDGTETTVEEQVRAQVRVDTEPEVGRLVTLHVTLPEDHAAEELSVRFSRETGRRAQIVGDPLRVDDHTWSVTARPLVSGSWRGVLVLEGTDAAGESFAIETHPIPGTIVGPGGALENPFDYTGVLNAPPNPVRTAFFILLLALGLALLGLLAWLLWRRLRRAREAAALTDVILDPFEELMLSAQRLYDLAIYRTQGTKAHYSLVSEAVRRYLERQHGSPALEMTDDELIEHLGLRHANDASALGLIPVFQNAAAAKFAQWETDEKTIRGDLERLHVYVESEKHRLRAQQAAAAAQADKPEAA